jgi:carbon storage regulator CsrA
MLVLTRKYQEKIRIGNNITITVLRTKGKAVRLGIEAPADVPVIRGELSFDHEAGQAEEPTEMVSFEESEPVKRTNRATRMATATRWETVRDSETKVTLSRVPRSKVAGILPKMVSSNAPLRAMMDQSSSR